ncbi:MAG: P-loop NTPase fold protein, partial [Nitrosopumilaceae archaeon]|nr:P-loop NTPase fold protein [Nitrosopumilaceae archaeon]
MTLLADLKKGKRGAIAKAISIIENDPKETKKILKTIFKNSGNAIVIGITGPAGAGKSSLINKTAVELRKLKTKPAVLAIDPTSHVTGGAILGDRVRMTESTDSGTYIRSIASRGATGAVSRSIRNSIRILEYA